MATMTHLAAGCTDDAQKPDSASSVGRRKRVRLPRLLSQPWHAFDLADLDGWVGVARHLTEPPAADCYWCGDLNRGGFCSCLASTWNDRKVHPSRVAVYGTRQDVLIAWQTYQQERLDAGLPAEPYMIEPCRPADLSDWRQVPPRGAVPHAGPMIVARRT